MRFFVCLILWFCICGCNDNSSNSDIVSVLGNKKKSKQIFSGGGINDITFINGNEVLFYEWDNIELKWVLNSGKKFQSEEGSPLFLLNGNLGVLKNDSIHFYVFSDKWITSDYLFPFPVPSKKIRLIPIPSQGGQGTNAGILTFRNKEVRYYSYENFGNSNYTWGETDLGISGDEELIPFSDLMIGRIKGNEVRFSSRFSNTDKWVVRPGMEFKIEYDYDELVTLTGFYYDYNKKSDNFIGIVKDNVIRFFLFQGNKMGWVELRRMELHL